MDGGDHAGYQSLSWPFPENLRLRIYGLKSRSWSLGLPYLTGLARHPLDSYALPIHTLFRFIRSSDSYALPIHTLFRFIRSSDSYALTIHTLFRFIRSSDSYALPIHTLFRFMLPIRKLTFLYQHLPFEDFVLFSCIV